VEIFLDAFPEKWPDIGKVRALKITDPKSAFFVVCGDLLDAFPEKWPDVR
jgi:hypothetical protein